MESGRTYPEATALLDGRVLILGGAKDNSFSPQLVSAEVYDPTTGQFTSAGSMSTDMNLDTATLLSDGRVLLTGRWNGCELYQP